MSFVVPLSVHNVSSSGTRACSISYINVNTRAKNMHNYCLLNEHAKLTLQPVSSNLRAPHRWANFCRFQKCDWRKLELEYLSSVSTQSRTLNLWAGSKGLKVHFLRSLYECQRQRSTAALSDNKWPRFAQYRRWHCWAASWNHLKTRQMSGDSKRSSLLLDRIKVWKMYGMISCIACLSTKFPQMTTKGLSLGLFSQSL